MTNLGPSLVLLREGLLKRHCDCRLHVQIMYNVEPCHFSMLLMDDDDDATGMSWCLPLHGTWLMVGRWTRVQGGWFGQLTPSRPSTR